MTGTEWQSLSTFYATARKFGFFAFHITCSLLRALFLLCNDFFSLTVTSWFTLNTFCFKNISSAEMKNQAKQQTAGESTIDSSRLKSSTNHDAVSTAQRRKQIPCLGDWNADIL